MGTQHIFGAAGINAVSNQCRSGGVHPVHHGRHMPGCPRQHHAGQARVVVAPHLAQYVHAIARYGLIHFQPLTYHFRFDFHPFIVDTAATACGQFRRQIQEPGGDSCSGGGIGYAHLPGFQQVAPPVDGFVRDPHPRFQCGNSLLFCHGRPLGEIICAPGHLALAYVGECA